MQQNLKDVYRYLQALYRYRFVATVLALIVMTIVGVYGFTRPKMYQADSTVFIEKSVIDSLVKGIAVTPDINDKIRVLQYALSSRDLIVKTLEEIDSDIFTKSKAEQQNYIADLKERTNIRVRGNDLFIVSLTDKDPNFVQKYINTLVSKYVEENISSKREEAYGANRFLDEQIALFKDKLEKAEDNIIKFRKEKGIYFSTDENATLEEIKQYHSEIEKVELNLETLNAKKKQLQEQLSTLSPTVESVFSADFGMDGIEGDPQLAAMQRKLNDLRLRYTENYPGIIQLKFEMESLRKRLEKEAESADNTDNSNYGPDASKMTSLNPLYLDIQQRLSDTQSEITSAQSTRENLKRLIAKREKMLNEVPETKKELNVLVQERNSLQQVYQDLLSRKGKSEVSKQMEIGNKTATFRIVDPAVYPEVPVSPNMLKYFALAIAAGLAAVAGLIFLVVNVDTRVRDVEIFQKMGVEVLAVVPHIADQEFIRRSRKRDFVFFGATSFYWLCFVGIFAYEILLRK